MSSIYSVEAVECAKANLMLSYTPSVTRHRESEYAAVEGFLRGRLQANAGGKLYVCGGPGTGKTLHVERARLAVAEDPEEAPPPPKKKQKKKAPAAASKKKGPPSPAPSKNTEFVALRGTEFNNNSGTFLTAIGRALNEKGFKKLGELVDWGDVEELETLLAAIEEVAVRGRKQRYNEKLVVVILDEIDALVDISRALKGVLKAADLPGSRLVLIGIANAIDVPRKLLGGLAECQTIVFRPYTVPELVDVVEERLADSPDLFDTKAIKFCAMKIAATTGDARRVLDLCLAALRLSDGAKVELSHAVAAVRASMGSTLAPKLANLTFHAKQMLAAACRLAERQQLVFTLAELQKENAKLGPASTSEKSLLDETFNLLQTTGFIGPGKKSALLVAASGNKPKRKSLKDGSKETFTLTADPTDLAAALATRAEAD